MITEKDKREAEEYCQPPAIGCDGKQHPQTIDAQAWAEEWLSTIKLDSGIPSDRGTMIGWFANAIMAGHDEAQRRHEINLAKDIDPMKTKIAAAKAELEKAKRIALTTNTNLVQVIVLENGIDQALKALS
jgi:hypothetical protein